MRACGDNSKKKKGTNEPHSSEIFFAMNEDYIHERMFFQGHAEHASSKVLHRLMKKSERTKADAGR